MKNFLTSFSLIILISFTAIIKTSSKKIEEQTFVLNENLILLTEKYELALLEHTYLSNPSRLISIIKENKSEEYIHLDSINFKTENKKNERK